MPDVILGRKHENYQDIYVCCHSRFISVICGGKPLLSADHSAAATPLPPSLLSTPTPQGGTNPLRLLTVLRSQPASVVEADLRCPLMVSGAKKVVVPARCPDVSTSSTWLMVMLLMVGVERCSVGEGVALLSDQCIKLDEGYTAPTKAYLCTEQQNFKRTEKKYKSECW